MACPLCDALQVEPEIRLTVPCRGELSGPSCPDVTFEASPALSLRLHRTLRFADGPDCPRFQWRLSATYGPNGQLLWRIQPECLIQAWRRLPVLNRLLGAEQRRVVEVIRASQIPAKMLTECAITYSEPHKTSDGFLISAFDGDRLIGRVVAEPCINLDCCHVPEIHIEESYRGQGIGTALLTRALTHSGMRVIVPVNISTDAISYWAHLARYGRMPVRLGLTSHEVTVLRYRPQLVAPEQRNQGSGTGDADDYAQR